MDAWRMDVGRLRDTLFLDLSMDPVYYGSLVLGERLLFASRGETIDVFDINNLPLLRADQPSTLVRPVRQIQPVFDLVVGAEFDRLFLTAQGQLISPTANFTAWITPDNSRRVLPIPHAIINTKCVDYMEESNSLVAYGDGTIKIIPLAGEVKSRAISMKYLKDICVLNATSIIVQLNMSTKDWTPDFSENAELKIRDLRGRPFPAALAGIAANNLNDNEYIYWLDREIGLASVEKAIPVKRCLTPLRKCLAAKAAKGGAFIAAASSDAIDIYVPGTTDLSKQQTLKCGSGQCRIFSISPDRSKVAYLGPTGHIEMRVIN